MTTNLLDDATVVLCDASRWRAISAAARLDAESWTSTESGGLHDRLTATTYLPPN